MSPSSGYHECPCRDCFEIAIGETDEGGPALCWECQQAGCDGSGEGDCHVPCEEDDHTCNEGCRCNQPAV